MTISQMEINQSFSASTVTARSKDGTGCPFYSSTQYSKSIIQLIPYPTVFVPRAGSVQFEASIAGERVATAKLDRVGLNG